MAFLAWVVKVNEQWVFGAVPVPAVLITSCQVDISGYLWMIFLETTGWNTDDYGKIGDGACQLISKNFLMKVEMHELGRLAAIHTILHPDVSHP